MPALLLGTTGSGLLKIVVRRTPAAAVGIAQCRLLSSKGKENSPHREFFEQVQQYRKNLRENLKSSTQHRHLLQTVSSLNQVVSDMESKKMKLDMTSQAVELPPTTATLEVISNGTTHMGPSVAIRTQMRTYLFNCPEGTSRFLSTMRIRPSNIYDFFITRGTWSNMGGISSILLGHDPRLQKTRIHGPHRIRNYLELVRPFMDTDTGATKYPVALEERIHEQKTYDDPALQVTYIPLYALFESGEGKRVEHDAQRLTSNQAIDTAFLVEMKKALPKVDTFKVMALKVPMGPLIGKLKAGETITLADGRIIKPEQVYVDDFSPTNDRPLLLVVEVDSEAKLDCIKQSPYLKPFTSPDNNPKRQLNHLVHFTRSELMGGEKYRQWMDSFGPLCQHIVLNGTGEALPLSYGPYRQQTMHHEICGEIFPLLHPQGEFIIGQDEECPTLTSTDENVLIPPSLKRFTMRGALNMEDPLVVDTASSEMQERRESGTVNAHLIDQTIAQFQGDLKSITTPTPDKYPMVTFLGTGSATPSRYRNVSGHLLELSPTSSILIDCGEGTYGQMRVLWGPEACDELLLSSLRAIFITHTHLDHMNGLFAVVEKREEVFKKRGTDYRKLVVACNRNVRRSITTYSRDFKDIEKLAHFVDISMYMVGLPAIRSRNPAIPRNDNPPFDPTESERRTTVDITQHMPPTVYSPTEWNLGSAIAVQVPHTRMAAGFVIVEGEKGRKVVFSGDTMPCDLLVSEGKGADLLIHEATFEDGFEKEAGYKRHSTTGQAVGIARRMGARHTILTHFSARYCRVPVLPDYLLRPNSNVGVAMDNMTIRFDHLPLMPKLLPVYKEIYRQDLFELGVKLSQRDLKEKLEREAAIVEETESEEDDDDNRCMLDYPASSSSSDGEGGIDPAPEKKVKMGR